MDYFKLFSIEQNYIINHQLLQKQYLALQKKNHPDTIKDKLQSYRNTAYSILINEAFKVLKDDYLRAKYILEMRGVIIDNNNLKLFISQNELEEILDQYELLDNLEDKDNLSYLYKIKEDRTKVYNNLVYDINIAFLENNLERALTLTIKLKYFTNLINNIKLKIKNGSY